MNELMVGSVEAARRLGMSKRYYLSLVASGRAPQGLTIGRRRLWPVHGPDGLEQWVLNGCKRGKQADEL